MLLAYAVVVVCYACLLQIIRKYCHHIYIHPFLKRLSLCFKVFLLWFVANEVVCTWLLSSVGGVFARINVVRCKTSTLFVWLLVIIPFKKVLTCLCSFQVNLKQCLINVHLVLDFKFMF